MSLCQVSVTPGKFNFALLQDIFAKVLGLSVEIAKNSHFITEMPIFWQFSFVLNVLNCDLPHLCGEIWTDLIIVSTNPYKGGGLENYLS